MRKGICLLAATGLIALGGLSACGSNDNTGGTTPLTNVGAGNFAAVKKGGYLPPPERPLLPPGRVKKS